MCVCESAIHSFNLEATESSRVYGNVLGRGGNVLNYDKT